MPKSKKVVLFLVEGVTDETVFGLILSRILEEKGAVRFKIVGGDVTTHTGTNGKNCLNRVVEQVKEFLAQDIYQKGDLCEIIHLVDLDGTFIPEECVCESNGKLPKGTHIYYTEESILTDHVEDIKRRNLQKSEVLDKLVHAKEIYGKIPYSVYFFSCNLEHVFYHEANADDQMKYAMSKEVEDKYVEHPESLITFLNSEDLVTGPTYEQSWETIKLDHQSLIRHSNFHIYLNQYQ